MNIATTTDTQIEQEIRAAFTALGRELATPEAFGGKKWQANSQYGCCLSEHATQAEAGQAAVDYYRERMNLIRQ